MRLWIAVFLPRLPLDAARPHWSEQPELVCAVLEQERVIALTPAARAAGLRLGLRRAGALALCPDALLLERDPAAEARTLQAAALSLLQYTPQLAVPDGDSLLLDVGASLMVFGGPRALYRRVRDTLAALDLQAGIAVAPTARGAWLLARSPGRRRVLREPALARRLDALPLVLLPEAQPRLAWLQGLGCKRLADLRRLPRAGLQRRSDPALLRALDAAYGDAAEVHAWLTPPAHFEARTELMDYVEHAEALLHVSGRLTEQLSGWLGAQRLAVRAITLTLEHERGRHARDPSQLHLAMAEPVWQSAHLRGLLRERLSRLELAAPVIAVTLSAPLTVDMPAISTTLFPEPGGNATDHARLLDLLCARLGPEQVRRPAPLADHRPEVANRWVALEAAGGRPPVLPPALERPFWLIEPAQALEIRAHRPVYQGQALRLTRGPERIESGWWDAINTQRDYFVAEDAAGARYWLYRERGGETARWFLHGRYA
ncbi:DNA polymerase [Bordetella genomosp. 5]|uniref:DNA polymerase n=1 Tax=Bordetella genomosp. 5 TaxID=1395608 RepID=A0A261TE78_9BORD|nr:DNA polymerase Y family protein [Bordetella genomosp. 5]OZI41264.1 DNA polymerase [Bordetella genomosp. 5]OZI47919.1 DNA polymerase [Bordetella genomosp. 5]